MSLLYDLMVEIENNKHDSMIDIIEELKIYKNEEQKKDNTLDYWYEMNTRNSHSYYE